ncbi:alpha/beta hydrolase [Myxococcaceae bacterium GXIMD 01537]
MAEVRARSGGVRIHYDDVGQGEPALLFLPGWATRRSVFDPLRPALGARHRLLVMDLRGHGESGQAGDFDSDALVEDALGVVEASGAGRIVPVALSHAGWLAIALRRRLGERVAGLVLLDWLVLDPPPPFLDVLAGLQTDRWRETRDALFGMWLTGVDSREVIRFVREDMGAFPEEMWRRAAREISRAYASAGSPLQALTTLVPPVPTLHLYSQPEDPAFRLGQESFADSHPWFQAVKLRGHSHFPTLEVPGEVAAGIERFVSSDALEREARAPGESAPTTS